MQYKFLALSALVAAASAKPTTSSSLAKPKHTSSSAAASSSSSAAVTPTPNSSKAVGGSSIVASSSGAINQESVISVLETALPSSLLKEALTNSKAVKSQVVSEFKAGHTPSWFIALPPAIQTYLDPSAGNGTANSTGIATNGTATATGMHNGTMSTTAKPFTTKKPATLTTNSKGQTVIAHPGTAKHSSQQSASKSAGGSGASSSSSSSGGASMPTAIVGAGLAGAVGLVGLLAL